MLKTKWQLKKKNRGVSQDRDSEEDFFYVVSKQTLCGLPEWTARELILFLFFKIILKNVYQIKKSKKLLTKHKVCKSKF